ncbi:hypothetical protein RFI_13900, partial [Reticulomyxa filosa]
QQKEEEKGGRSNLLKNFDEVKAIFEEAIQKQSEEQAAQNKFANEMVSFLQTQATELTSHAKQAKNIRNKYTKEIENLKAKITELQAAQKEKEEGMIKEIKRLNEELRSMHRQMECERGNVEEHDQLKARYQKMQSKYDQLKAEHKACASHEEQLHNDHRQIKTQQLTMASKHEELKSQCDVLAQEKDALQSNLTDVSKQHVLEQATRIKEYKQLEEQHEQLNAHHEEAKSTYENEQTKVQHATMTTKFEELQSQSHTLEREKTELQDTLMRKSEQHILENAKLAKEYDQLKAQYSELTIRYGEMNAEYQKLKSEYETAKNEHMKVSSQHEELFGRQTALIGVYEELKAQHEELKSCNGNLTQDKDEVHSRHDKLNSEYETLKGDHEKVLDGHGQLKIEHEKLLSICDQLILENKNLQTSQAQLQSANDLSKATDKTLRDEIESLKSMCGRFIVENETQQTSNKQLQSENDNLKHASEQLQNTVESLKLTCDRLGADVPLKDRLQCELNELQTTHGQMEKQYEAVKAELQKLILEHEDLQLEFKNIKELYEQAKAQPSHFASISHDTVIIHENIDIQTEESVVKTPVIPKTTQEVMEEEEEAQKDDVDEFQLLLNMRPVSTGACDPLQNRDNAMTEIIINLWSESEKEEKKDLESQLTNNCKEEIINAQNNIVEKRKESPRTQLPVSNLEQEKQSLHGSTEQMEKLVSEIARINQIIDRGVQRDKQIQRKGDQSGDGTDKITLKNKSLLRQLQLVDDEKKALVEQCEGVKLQLKQKSIVSEEAMAKVSLCVFCALFALFVVIRRCAHLLKKLKAELRKAENESKQTEQQVDNNNI